MDGLRAPCPTMGELAGEGREGEGEGERGDAAWGGEAPWGGAARSVGLSPLLLRSVLLLLCMS
jgi:hypothetical protein